MIVPEYKLEDYFKGKSIDGIELFKYCPRCGKKLEKGEWDMIEMIIVIAQFVFLFLGIWDYYINDNYPKAMIDFLISVMIGLINIIF